MSERRFGAPTFEGTRIEIDVDAAKKAGAEFISHKELVKQVRDSRASSAVHPERIEKWLDAQKGPKGEKEALFKRHIEPGSIETPGKKIIRGVGRAGGVLGTAMTVKDLYSAAEESAETNSVAPFAAESLRQVGGWVGATAGFKAGTAAGAAIGLGTGPGALVTAFVGGVIGGTAGYLGSDLLADLVHAN